MLLTLKNIVAGYGNITALKGISLSVPEGKIVTPVSYTHLTLPTIA